MDDSDELWATLRFESDLMALYRTVLAHLCSDEDTCLASNSITSAALGALPVLLEEPTRRELDPELGNYLVVQLVLPAPGRIEMPLAEFVAWHRGARSGREAFRRRIVELTDTLSQVSAGDGPDLVETMKGEYRRYLSDVSSQTRSRGNVGDFVVQFGLPLAAGGAGIALDGFAAGAVLQLAAMVPQVIMGARARRSAFRDRWEQYLLDARRLRTA
jgi:hypothetical protein